MGILCYLLIFWTLLHIYREYLSPKRRKMRRKLMYLRNHFQDRINYDRDILEEEKFAVLQDYHGQAEEMLKKNEADVEDIDKFLKVAEKKYARVYPKKKGSAIKETTELLVVVFGVVMGLRALFFQPFKIPTGSMQPTLYGIHFEKMENVPSGTIKRFFDYLNYGASYVDVTIRKDGYAEGLEDHSLRVGPVTLINKTQLLVGGAKYSMNVDQPSVLKHVLPNALNKQGLPYNTGDVLARGAVIAGDYIMVDRVSYRFRDPRRGDIVVFITEGLSYPGGRGLRGRHFIKRLVGLPGDTLRVVDRKLEVKQSGASEFVVVDDQFAKAFGRIYSDKGGYHGYTHTFGGKHFAFQGDPVTLKKDEYLVLGDNSRNSADGRAWGVLPRKNIIGRACLVWWPFSRRWGRVDIAEPVDEPTPPPTDGAPDVIPAPTPSLRLDDGSDDGEDTTQ